MLRNDFLILGIMSLFLVTQNTAMVKKLKAVKWGLIALFGVKAVFTFLVLWLEIRNLSTVLKLLIAFWFAYESSTFYKEVKQ
jgi:hypothetical protein